MLNKYNFLILFFFPLILSLTEPQIYELENDNSQKFNLSNMPYNTLYIFSKNTITGTFTYDIDSPVALNLSYAKTNSKDSIPSVLEVGHNENITRWKNNEGYQYFFSIPVLISEEDTYTMLRIEWNEYNSNITQTNINVKLTGNYTWKITVFVLFLFIFFIGAIFSTCYFARNCLSKCCNFSSSCIYNNYCDCSACNW